jgi:glycogen debranching enzyme
MGLLPYLKSDNHLLNSAFRVAVGDLVGNIQPFKDGLLEEAQPCILAGLEYDTPWTRDTAINVWNGAGLVFPQASANTLLSVLERSPNGEPVIGGQYWDAIIWTTGAWAYYMYTGDRELLALAFAATQNSLSRFEAEEFDSQTGLFRGPACYGDGVGAYPDIYAQTNGSSSILEWPKCNPEKVVSTGYGIPMQTLSTNCLYYNAYTLLGAMARELGQPLDSAWADKAANLRAAINQHLWDAANQRYRYLIDPFGGSDHEEGLGNTFAVLFGVASQEQAGQVIANQTVTPNGIPCLWPSFSRYDIEPGAIGRHSGTVWPHVQGFWGEVCARAGSAEAFRFELFKLAELAVRDGMFAEIYHPITGEVYGGIQEGAPGWRWHSCRRQTWSATAFLRMVLMGLLGMRFSPQGVAFQPLLPDGLKQVELRGLPYRGQLLNITLTGQGSTVSGFSVNGSQQSEPFLSASETGEQEVVIRLG